MVESSAYAVSSDVVILSEANDRCNLSAARKCKVLRFAQNDNGND
jgi:hypothetical protein